MLSGLRLGLYPSTILGNISGFPPKFFQNVLKIWGKYPNSKAYLDVPIYLLPLTGLFVGFNLMYWTTMGGFYFLVGSIFFQNGCFSERIRSDSENTARADKARLGQTCTHTRTHTHTHTHTHTNTHTYIYIYIYIYMYIYICIYKCILLSIM